MSEVPVWARRAGIEHLHDRHGEVRGVPYQSFGANIRVEDILNAPIHLETIGPGEQDAIKKFLAAVEDGEDPPPYRGPLSPPTERPPDPTGVASAVDEAIREGLAYA